MRRPNARGPKSVGESKPHAAPCAGATAELGPGHATKLRRNEAGTARTSEDGGLVFGRTLRALGAGATGSRIATLALASLLASFALAGSFGVAGCETTAEPAEFSEGGGGATGAEQAAASGGGAAAATTSTGEGGLAIDGGSTGQGGGLTTCTPKGPTDDVDEDGYTPDEGDCNDCDPNRNPNAVEVATEPGAEPFDEDCDGEVDEIDPPCDDGLVVDDPDPISAARAADLCKTSKGPNDWGLVSAAWVMPNGSPPPAGQLAAYHLGHGLLSGFGPNVQVRRGTRMLALSSGTARQPTDPGYQDVSGYSKGYTASHPPGFPKESPACPGVITGTPNDAAAVEFVVRAPSNAHGFSFDFDFYTYEWPGFVCSQYNDFFVALLTPPPPGQADGNISFDSQGNPVSVNNAFIAVCGCDENPPAPCIAGGKSFTCPLGDVELIGTGFGFDTGFADHGATSWLVTKAPIEPGSEFSLRFAVYDSGDGVLDTTTLIDNWQWIAKPGTKVGTNPIPK